MFHENQAARIYLSINLETEISCKQFVLIEGVAVLWKQFVKRLFDWENLCDKENFQRKTTFFSFFQMSTNRSSDSDCDSEEESKLEWRKSQNIFYFPVALLPRQLLTLSQQKSCLIIHVQRGAQRVCKVIHAMFWWAHEILWKSKLHKNVNEKLFSKETE